MRLLFILLAIFVAAAADSGQALFDALHAGQTSSVRTALKSGSDPNARDATGATPLMYAAAFSPLECMELLIRGGARVNDASNAGFTALMWSLSDPAKVRLLLRHKADVNAKAKDGHAAMMLASQNAFRQTASLLLAAGAADEDGMQPRFRPILKLAPDAFTEVRSTGIEPMHLVGMAPLYAVTHLTADSEQALGEMIDAGVDPNAPMNVVSVQIPPLAMAATFGNGPAVRVLLARGANPNARGSGGLTPLIMAALSDRENVSVMRALLDRGADIHAKDQEGRNALDWALLRGRTAPATFLREAGLRESASPVPAPASVAHPRSAREAVSKALQVLMPTGPVFFKQTGCISCHNTSLPQMAASRARAKNIPLPAEVAEHPSKSTMAMWRPLTENLIVGASTMGGLVANASYGLVALAEEGFAPNLTTSAAAIAIARLQRTDGSWTIADLRPPIGVSDTKWTALVARSIDVYMPKGRAAEKQMRLRRARNYLTEAKSRDTQDQAFQLLGLRWMAAKPSEIAKQRQRLIALQREDGGWGQRPEMPSDAYATGQALFALEQVDARYEKGVDYLLRNQMQDGTWFVRSRVIGFQPYFETGFPHGKSQFISAAATSWAALALTGVVDAGKIAMGR